MGITQRKKLYDPKLRTACSQKYKNNTMEYKEMTTNYENLTILFAHQPDFLK